MIVRIWHGRVPSTRADEYAQFMKQRAAPDYAAVPGLQKLYFLRENKGDVTHFQLVTLWDSMEAMKRFAGENPRVAKYYPEDDEFLLEKEPEVSIVELFHEQ